MDRSGSEGIGLMESEYRHRYQKGIPRRVSSRYTHGGEDARLSGDMIGRCDLRPPCMDLRRGKVPEMRKNVEKTELPTNQEKYQK